MRLIDADAFQEWMLKSEYNASENEKYDQHDNIDRPMYYSTRSLIDVMNHRAPTIDAVPVVRCAECQYSHITGLSDPRILDCEKNGLVMSHGYCNYGKLSGI